MLQLVLALKRLICTLTSSNNKHNKRRLQPLQRRLQLTYLFISHNLAVVYHISTRVGVMYLGKLVETGPADTLYRRPLHPYTQALLAAALPARPDDTAGPPPLVGELPSPLAPPSGCRFRTRCPRAEPACAASEPVLRDMGDGQFAACHLV